MLKLSAHKINVCALHGGECKETAWGGHASQAPNPHFLPPPQIQCAALHGVMVKPSHTRSCLKRDEPPTHISHAS